jgi:hypothetical protein
MGFSGLSVTYLKINFAVGPNAPYTGPGKTVKVQLVQTSTVSFLSPQ